MPPEATKDKSSCGTSAQVAASGTEESLRFGFGQNWADFIERHFSDNRIEASKKHLLNALRIDSLAGLTMLDIGCGSGLHSLAAMRSGAKQVMGFDFDPNSVATSLKVRAMAAGDDPNWTAEQGSVLDSHRMRALPQFDVVYSWGVLHHTGALWQAMDNATIPRKRDGVLYIALYSSDQYVDPPASYWVEIKRKYNRSGPLGKRLMEWRHASRSFAGAIRRLEMPWTLLRNYSTRGMDFWIDLRDWLGGWPIEFASYSEVEAWGNRHGLTIVNAIVGEGCTEYVLADTEHNDRWRMEEARRKASCKPLPGPFVHGSGHAWIARLPDLAGRGDDSLPPRGSTLMLYDRGKPFGLPHFREKHVSRFGGGRFMHRGDAVVFSTPDGSDPNADPARWAYCADY